MKRRRVLSSRVASLLVFASGSALAADPAPADPPASAPPPPAPEPTEIRVIGNKTDSLQKIPGSGHVITTKEFERTSPYDAAEMLRRVPGLVVRQEEGGGGRLDIGVRGLDPGRSRRVLVLEDGMPVAINPYAEPDLYFAPPIERMRSVEVVKGSGAILFGPQTIGGVVNFLTLMPPDREHVTVDALGGLEPGYARGLASYGNRHGPVRYVVQVFHKRGDGFRNEAFTATDVFGKAIFDTSEKGTLTLKLAFHQDTAQSDAVGLTQRMFETTPRRGTLAPNDHLGLSRYEVGLTHEHRFSKDTKLQTLVYAYRTSRLWRRQDYLRNPVAGLAYDRVVGDTRTPNGAIYFLDSNTILDRDYDVLGIEPRLEHRFETFGVKHTVETGTRVLVESAEYEQRAGQTPRSEAGSLDLVESHASRAFSAYIQDRLAFLDTLLVTPGMRIETAQFRRSVSRQGSSDVAFSGTSDTSALIPGVGIIGGTKRNHVFGGLHVGFSPPRVTSNINPRGVSQNLAPEENIQYELGTRLAGGKLVRFEATGFLSNFKNQAVSLSDGPQTVIVNAGKTRHLGAESGATLALGEVFDLPFVLDLTARYTYVRATFVEGPNGGNRLPYSPEHAAVGVLDFDHESGWGAQAALTHIGPQFTDAEETIAEDATGRTGKLPSYTTVDFNARYKHRPTGVSVRLLVKNALDQPFIISRRPEGIFASGFRQVLLGLRWDWDGPEGSP